MTRSASLHGVATRLGGDRPVTLKNDLGEPLTVNPNGEEVSGETEVQIGASGLQVPAAEAGDLVTGSVWSLRISPFRRDHLCRA